jgi:hypothetical protein
MMAPPPLVPVRFVARDAAKARYRIAVGERACMTPCTLDVPASGADVRADASDRSFSGRIVVPNASSTIEVSHASRMHALVGGVLLGVGLAGIGLGAWFVAGHTFTDHDVVGGIDIGAGGVATVVGIVELAISGGGRFKLRDDAVAEARP